MKHGKKPTRRQKELLAEKKLNPNNWLIVKDTPDLLEIVHRISRKLKKYSKIGG